MIWFIIAAYLVQSALAFRLMLKSSQQFCRRIGAFVTNGDVIVFAILAAFPASIIAAIIIAAMEGWSEKSSEWANRKSPLNR